MRSDVFFFLTIFFAIFVGWVATGGPTRPISFAGPYITPITDVGQTQQGYGTTSWSGWSASGSTDWWSASHKNDQDIWSAQSKLSGLQKDYRDATLFGTPSSYKDQVTLSGLSVYTDDPKQEYITISTSWNAKQPIDITGWKLVSVATDNYGYIPQGITTFRSGEVNGTSDIMLAPGEQAYVITGESPVGVSFRENECMGYLSERQKFYPSLYSYCPRPQDDFDRFYGGDAKNTLYCENYIKSLNSCEVPKSLPTNISSACISFVDNYLSYNGCVASHSNDQGFKGSTWRVYLGRHETNKNKRKDLWEPQRDIIKLLDRDGKTVATYSY